MFQYAASSYLYNDPYIPQEDDDGSQESWEKEPQVTMFDEEQYKLHGENTMVVYAQLLAKYIKEPTSDTDNNGCSRDNADDQPQPVEEAVQQEDK